MMSTHSSRAVRLAETAAFAGALVVGGACSLPEYLRTTMFSGGSLADSTLLEDVVAVRLRVGREWLEMRVRNVGARPVHFSWNAAALILPDSAPLTLITSTQLEQLHLAALAHTDMRTPARNTVAPCGPGSLGGPCPAVGPWFSALPIETVTLDVGQALEEVLYPATHLSVSGGALSITPLLDERKAPVRRPGVENSILEVRIPILRDGKTHLVRVTAHADDRPPSRGR